MSRNSPLPPMHEDQSDTPQNTAQTAPHADPVETRRAFLKDIVVSTGSAIIDLTLSPAMATAQQHNDHGHHPDMNEKLSWELAHPFNQNPDAWLDAHEKEWKECFDCSDEPVTEMTVLCIDERMTLEAKMQPGKRILRVAGSGVLWEDPDAFVDAIVRQVESLSQGRDISTIKVRISSHGNKEGDGCGAAGIKFGGNKNPDQCARDYQKNVIVAKLKERGINAEFIGDREMRKGPHDGIDAFVDCTGGRLQRLPGLKGYIIAMPNSNVEHAIEEALLALGIASGNHAYGSMLSRFTFVVFTDPAHPMDSQEIISALDQRTRALRAQGMDIRIVTREAPAVLQVK